MRRDDLRAQGDRDLADQLLKKHAIRQAIERHKKATEDAGARRQLLATSVRLSAEMAPEIDAALQRCRQELEVESPLELFVYPGPTFNAAAVHPEGGRLFILLSSSLLEAFEQDELRFVIGHELGHHLFEHHAIPVGALLGNDDRIDPGTVLQLFSWQRYAEISSDRAGLVCAGGLDAAARALFKVASGLRGSKVTIRIEQFLAQLGDLRAEVERTSKADEPMRPDWFSSHPFSPMRLRAAELFSQSERMKKGGTPLSEIEAQVEELMNLMNPSYLKDRSESAEAMRRLLLGAGIAIAYSAEGESRQVTLDALEELLGPGSLSSSIDPEAIKSDMPRRIEAVIEGVPLLRRAQLLRDLCVIARADGVVTETEKEILFEIAEAVGVDPSVIVHSTHPSSGGEIV